MKNVNLYLFIILFFLTFTRAKGQTSQPVINDFSQLNKILPPPPNTASLGKYGGLNVGLSTGSPNFSIPLYDWFHDQITPDLRLTPFGK